MKIINEVRMNLKVSTLADITSIDGKRMLHEAMKAEPLESCSSQRYTWLNTAEQPKTNKKMWENLAAVNNIYMANYSRTTKKQSKNVGKSTATFLLKNKRRPHRHAYGLKYME